MRRFSKWSLIAGTALVALTAAVLSTRAGQDQPPTRSEFMRRKLEYSKLVLEGLALEDYAKVSRGANALRVLSQAAEWEVPTIPNATDYVSLTREFQNIADELGRTSKEKNLDGSTLAYVRLTMNCVNCHKYVRFAPK